MVIPFEGDVSVVYVTDINIKFSNLHFVGVYLSILNQNLFELKSHDIMIRRYVECISGCKCVDRNHSDHMLHARTESMPVHLVQWIYTLYMLIFVNTMHADTLL